MTTEQIIELLEMELAEAYELHDRAKDRNEATYFYHKITFILHLLDEITQDVRKNG